MNIDGNISLRGSTNGTIFINGKPSLLMRKNSATALYQKATRKRNSQIIYLGFTWRFGNKTKKSKEELEFEDTIE